MQALVPVWYDCRIPYGRFVGRCRLSPFKAAIAVSRPSFIRYSEGSLAIHCYRSKGN